jgi:dihydroflavonol-4-reductase
VTAGHEVRALARSTQAAADVAAAGGRPMMGDLADPGSLERLVSGSSWVFHIAGINQLCPLDPEMMWSVNVGGTARILEACRRQGVGRLILTSSAVTIGEPHGVVGNETTRHRGSHLTHYERTKAEAERLALAREDGPEVVAVNPSSVQGPGRATGTGRILLAACRGRLPFAIDATFSLVDIDDCARGHLLAADRGAPGSRYLLSGATLTTREAVQMISTITGRASSTRYLRTGLLPSLGGVAALVFGVLSRQPPLCPEAVRVMRHGHRYDGTRAVRELGLSYTPLEDTFRRVLDWFTQEGLLD